ncbi:hypothetical protein [Roseburia hominis]|uniref:hypothetical protein n=1 Tax=Roseburia hominis TaxID=301301 RepID=UPI0026739171|nr:hypothetical protein [Roseburia hominis]
MTKPKSFEHYVIAECIGTREYFTHSLLYNGQTYFGNNASGWAFVDNGNRPLGSMFCNETTYDGYKVNHLGAWMK